MRQVYFVGAGISANPPTGFPLANTIVTEILRAVAPDPESFALFQNLADSNRPDKRNPGDYLRFESLIDTVQQLVDPDLAILRFIELFTIPNLLHVFLAERAMAGDIVITTNFDCLIEEAIRSLGRQPRSICSTTDFESWTAIPSDRVPVFKIHGSYRRYDGSHDEPSLDTLQATLSSLSIGAKELILPEVKRDFLIAVTTGRPMIVCGYSGGDDLDIVPTLQFLSPHSIEWVLHTATRNEVHDVTEQWRLTLRDVGEGDLSTRDQFFRRRLLDVAYPLYLYEVNTVTRLLSTHIPIDDAKLDQGIEKLRTFIQDWERTFFVPPHLKESVAGYILFILTRFEEAYERYRKAWALLEEGSEPSAFAEVARMISRNAVEISKFEEAEKWAQMASDLAPPGTTVKAKCLHQLGYSYFKLSRHREALACYEEFAEISRKRKFDRFLSYVLHDSALIFQELSQFERALPLYEESIELSSRDGDFRHVMFSVHQLGTACYDLGNFEMSRSHHLQALNFARTLGDHAQIDNSEHELGMLDFLAGRLVDSIRRFRRGIEIAGQTGRSQYVGMDCQHICISLMEARKIRLVGRMLNSAKEQYRSINDEITESELQSYICQYHLLTGNYPSALAAAEAGHSIASRFQAQEYQTRAAFMLGLVTFLSTDGIAGSRKMFEAMQLAHTKGYKALLLDQLCLCAQFGVHLSSEEALTWIQWAIETYSNLGNKRRQRVLHTYFAQLSLTGKES